MEQRLDMVQGNWTSTCYCYRNFGIYIKKMVPIARYS
jgi:hypothetical protein